MGLEQRSNEGRDASLPSYQVGVPRFELGLNPPKGLVLPLHYTPIWKLIKQPDHQPLPAPLSSTLKLTGQVSYLYNVRYWPPLKLVLSSIKCKQFHAGCGFVFRTLRFLSLHTFFQSLSSSKLSDAHRRYLHRL